MNVFEDILGRLDKNIKPVAGGISRDIREALRSPASGTMKAWMQARDGKRVHTVQVDNDAPARVWIPQNRVIDASRATLVEFDGSARYYSRMRVLHTTERCLIVADETHTIAYLVW